MSADSWSAAEDELIVSGHRQHGAQWSVIAATMTGRSDSAIQNRWNATMRRAAAASAAQQSPSPPVSSSAAAEAAVAGRNRKRSKRNHAVAANDSVSTDLLYNYCCSISQHVAPESNAKGNQSARTLLRNLGYEFNDALLTTKEIDFHLPGVTVETLSEDRFVIRCENRTWYLHSKIVLDAEQLAKVSCIAVRFAPENSTVSLQADTHSAGNVFVGMIMTFGVNSVPINLVSGDIGCGLTVIPVITSAGEHRKLSGDKLQDDAFHSYVLTVMRNSLVRGRAAEEGFNLNSHLRDASKFYGNDELTHWIDQLGQVLETAGFDVTAEPTLAKWAMPSKELTDDPDGLTAHQKSVLRYVGRFAQSLGSSGNHFCELATDDRDHYWLVIHSGSRGLGAKVYDVVAQACRTVNNGLEIATGKLAEFYALAYDALNKFAKLNRVLCAIAVLKNLQGSYSYDTSSLHDAMRRSHLFAPAIAACGDEEIAMLSLISGLTHNGIKAFVNDERRESMFVLSKGAVAMTKRAAASIVALRPGDGCYLWTLADPKSQWREQDVALAIAKRYRAVHHADDVIFSGHGAGRSQSTGTTERASTFEDLVDFYEEHGIAGNVAPGVLGDNPRIAYNALDKIIAHLPLDLACTKSMLKTRVSYKEGLCYKKEVNVQCTEYIRKNWQHASPNRRLWFDIILCQGKNGLSKDEFDRMQDEQNKIINAYCQATRTPSTMA